MAQKNIELYVGYENLNEDNQKRAFHLGKTSRTLMQSY